MVRGKLPTARKISLIGNHLNGVWSENESHSVMSDSCDPMDCSLPGSFVHGIFQARILEWFAISYCINCVYVSLFISADMQSFLLLERPYVFFVLFPHSIFIYLFWVRTGSGFTKRRKKAFPNLWAHNYVHCEWRNSWAQGVGKHGGTPPTAFQEEEPQHTLWRRRQPKWDIKDE